MKIHLFPIFLSISYVIAEDVLVIRRLEKGYSDDAPFLKVCFDRPQRGLPNSAGYELLISKQEHETQKAVSSISLSNDICQIFVTDIEHLRDQTTFRLTLYRVESIKHEVVARGQTTVTLGKSINYSAKWLGKDIENIDDQAIRIQHDYKSSLLVKLKAKLMSAKEGHTFDCKVSPCYMLVVSSDIQKGDYVQLCLSNVALSDTRGCEVCERRPLEGFPYGAGLEMFPPEAIALTYSTTVKSHVTVTGPLDDAVKSLEIVFYKKGDEKYKLVYAYCTPSSNLSKSCTSSSIKNMKENYSVLLVGVNAQGKITHSTTSLFENYGTNVQQLTSDIIEVEWTSSEEAFFTISLNKDITGGYHSTSVQCGGTNNTICSTFFINLEPDTYRATVVKNVEGTKNLVAATMKTEKDKQEHLKVFSIAIDATDIETGNTNITVCIEDSVESSKFRAVLIDRLGNTLRTEGTLQGSDILCFSDMILKPDFDTSGSVRILVTTKFMFSTFTGDSELYLLDPNISTVGRNLKVDQVGEKIVRTKWLNLNDGQVTIGGIASFSTGIIRPSSSIVKCSYKDECGKYSHFQDKTASYQITEFGETMQIVRIKTELKDVQSIKVTSQFIEWERRVKVCFTEVQGATSYELDLGVNSALWENIEEPELTASHDKKLCTMNKRSLEVGSHTLLETMVTAYDSNGIIIAAGKDLMNMNFIGSSMSIFGASTTDGVIASWQHLKVLSVKAEYRVTLKDLNTSDSKTIEEIPVAKPTWSYKFRKKQDGLYAICLKAYKIFLKSFNGEICTDVLSVEGSRASTVSSVENFQLRSTSKESVIVTWEPPVGVEASNFVVSWTTESPSDYDQSSEAGFYTSPPVMNEQEFFMIVSQSELTCPLLDLQEEYKYFVCVAAVKDNVMGIKICGMIDLYEHHSLSYPRDIEYKNGILRWNGNSDSTCQVEWSSMSDNSGWHTEVEGTSHELQLKPGVWTISVRNVTLVFASGPSKTHVSVEGIIISSRQLDQSTLLITWYENQEVPHLTTPETFSYDVSVTKNKRPFIGGPSVRKCSGRRGDCSFELRVMGVSPDDEISVKLNNLKTGKSVEITPRMTLIPKVQSLSMKITDSGHGWVSWDKVSEAKRYKYILYDHKTLQKIRRSGYQPGNTLHLELSQLEDNVLVVQGCTDEDHCGDPSSITLMASNNVNTVVVIFVAAISSALFFVIMIHFLFRKRKPVSSPQRQRRTSEHPRYYINKAYKDV